jgi:hypothetical protein
MGRGAGLDGLDARKTPCLYRALNQDSSFVQPVAEPIDRLPHRPDSFLLRMLALRKPF